MFRAGRWRPLRPRSTCAGRLTRPELRRLLGFGTRAELDGFLKARGINEGMTLAEFQRDRQTLDRLGL